MPSGDSPAEESSRARYKLSPQRALNMSAGLRWFAGWLADQMTDGLAVIEADVAGTLGEAAARLTDAQLPGPAGALRSWEARVGAEPDWAAGLFAEFGYWHLIAILGKNLQALPQNQRAGILDCLGLNVRKVDLEAVTPHAEDEWACIGVERGEAERVYYRRTYWAGTGAEHWAVQLDFNFGSPVPAGQVAVGTSGRFGVRAYPSGLPGRILGPTDYTVQRADRPPFHQDTWEAQRRVNAGLLARCPWLRELPVAVGPIAVRLQGEQVALADSAGDAFWLPAGRDDAASWRLLAIAAGHEAVVFGVICSGQLRVLSAWCSGGLWSVNE